MCTHADMQSRIAQLRLLVLITGWAGFWLCQTGGLETGIQNASGSLPSGKKVGIGTLTVRQSPLGGMRVEFQVCMMKNFWTLVVQQCKYI